MKFDIIGPKFGIIEIALLSPNENIDYIEIALLSPNENIGYICDGV
jgi:hypothetical protein